MLDIEHVTFTPLVFKTTGAMGKECLGFPRRLTELIAIKKGEHYAPIKSKLQHPPPPPGKALAFDHFLCPAGSGEFDLQGLPGGFDLCLGVVGKIKPEVSVFFFSGAEVANVFRRDGIN